MKYYNDFFITPIEEQPIHDFCISAIHILPKCSANLKKGLRQEYYFLNDRCYLENKKVVLSDSMLPRDFYGKRINVQAIVGVNGSGKSSLLEIIYRVINNLGCLLNRGKRRKSSDALYFIKGLYAEIYYVIDGKLARISCFDNVVEFQVGNGKVVSLVAFDMPGLDDEVKYVLMSDFVKWAKESLFYSIVTNYSLQAFNANDFVWEKCNSLDKDAFEVKGNSWINSLFHKNDGYMTPIVLNPYRDNGVFDINKEHRLTISRLASIMIYAQMHNREFMKEYRLNSILYTFDKDGLEEKYLKDYDVKEEVFHKFHLKTNEEHDIGSEILYAYGCAAHLNLDDVMQRTAAIYLIYKTFAIANSYPSYEKFAILGELDGFVQDVTEESRILVWELVKTILKDKSHVTLKIRQTLHFIDALLDGRVNSQWLRSESISYPDYVVPVFKGAYPRKMRDIQEYLPPSFFKTQIFMDRVVNGERVNRFAIPVEQMSSGERQYLYTFSTYIYHILNLLSIQESHRVKYRHINLILDEVEMCFHPEYQRRFVDELLGYIKRLSMNRHASFNIMIATHSPFILSDIPQCNILYLENGMVPDTRDFKNPFAANICDILYQSFFLKNGFTGEYARRKVTDMITRLRPNSYFTEKWEEQYWKLMEIIGDPFLKMQLQQLYDDRRKRNEKD